MLIRPTIALAAHLTALASNGRRGRYFNQGWLDELLFSENVPDEKRQCDTTSYCYVMGTPRGLNYSKLCVNQVTAYYRATPHTLFEYSEMLSPRRVIIRYICVIDTNVIKHTTIPVFNEKILIIFIKLVK